MALQELFMLSLQRHQSLQRSVVLDSSPVRATSSGWGRLSPLGLNPQILAGRPPFSNSMLLNNLAPLNPNEEDQGQIFVVDNEAYAISRD